jgi:hypothetical protein
MSADPIAVLHAEIDVLDIRDKTAVRAIAAKIEALGDATQAHDLCSRSNAVRAAVGQMRAEALTAMLARDANEEFIRKTADAVFMAPVEIEALRIPRYVAVEQLPCACGAGLMIPYAKQGGPGFGFECPGCNGAFVARPSYAGGEYRVVIEADTRPPKKRRKRNSMP